MEGGGTLKGILKSSPNDTGLLKSIIDSNLAVDTLHKDSPYSPQLLMYLDNKTKSQEKDILTKEEAIEILEKLGLPTKDDLEFSTDFYGTSEESKESVLNMAQTALGLDLGNTSEYSLEKDKRDKINNIFEQAEYNAEQARKLPEALESKKRCEEDLIKLTEKLRKKEEEQTFFLVEMQRNAKRITENLKQIKEKDSELTQIRNNLENLTKELRGSETINQDLFTKISGLNVIIKNLESQIITYVTENDSLTQKNETQEALLQNKNNEIYELKNDLTTSIEENSTNTELTSQLSLLKQNFDEQTQKIENLKVEQENQLLIYQQESNNLKQKIQNLPDLKTHTNILEKLSNINLLLHYLKLSKNLSDIQIYETERKKTEDELLEKGRECDQLQIKIQELQGNIAGLLERASQDINKLPQNLQQLESLNTQSQQILEKLQEINRTQTSQLTSEQLQIERQQLSSELTRISNEISSLQGLIQGRFGGIDGIIKSGNTALTDIIKEQGKISLEQILAGQSKTDYNTSEILNQGKQLSEQTKILQNLKEQFEKLQTESNSNLTKSSRMHTLLEKCLRDKQKVEEEVFTSKNLADTLKTQLATLEANKTQAEQARQRADEQAKSLTTAVQAAAQAGVKALENAKTAQNAQLLLQQRLQQEEGNTRQIQNLQKALEKEQEKFEKAKLDKLKADEEKQSAIQQQEQAQQLAQEAREKAAQAEGAAKQAEQILQTAQQTFQSSTNEFVKLNSQAEIARTQELQRIQQDVEQRCNEREQRAIQQAKEEAKVRINELQARLDISEQLQRASQAAIDATIATRLAEQAVTHRNNIEEIQRHGAQGLTEQTTLVATKDATLAERDAQIIRLNTQIEELTREVVRIRDLENTIRDMAIQDRDMRTERDNLQAIVDWNRQPQINILDPPIPDGGLLAGTQITFNVRNRGPGGRTVAFFYYGVRTEYMDIIDDLPKNYTIEVGLRSVGAFNF